MYIISWNCRGKDAKALLNTVLNTQADVIIIQEPPSDFRRIQAILRDPQIVERERPNEKKKRGKRKQRPSTASSSDPYARSYNPSPEYHAPTYPFMSRVTSNQWKCHIAGEGRSRHHDRFVVLYRASASVSVTDFIEHSDPTGADDGFERNYITMTISKGNESYVVASCKAPYDAANGDVASLYMGRLIFDLKESGVDLLIGDTNLGNQREAIESEKALFKATTGRGDNSHDRVYNLSKVEARRKRIEAAAFGRVYGEHATIAPVRPRDTAVDRVRDCGHDGASWNTSDHYAIYLDTSPPSTLAKRRTLREAQAAEEVHDSSDPMELGEPEESNRSLSSQFPDPPRGKRKKRERSVQAAANSNVPVEPQAVSSPMPEPSARMSEPSAKKKNRSDDGT